MSAPNQQLGSDGSIALGDDIPIALSVFKAGAAYPVTVTDAIATFKRNVTDDDSAAVITKRLGTGIAVSGSTVTVTIASSDQTSLSQTTTLAWACRIKESSGAQTEIASGTIQLTRQPVRNPL